MTTLYSGYNFELTKSIFKQRYTEKFINPIHKNTIIEKLNIYLKQLILFKDYALQYNYSINDINDTIVITNSIKNSIMNNHQENYSSYDIYELCKPLLMMYYKNNKTANQLSKDIDIQIIIPNNQLEEEYRTRFENHYYINQQELYP